MTRGPMPGATLSAPSRVPSVLGGPSRRSRPRSGRGTDERPDRMQAIMDWRLELVQVPVSDVDRAKSFYTEKAGFNADHDHRVGDDIRFVQLTPSGSACS